MNGKEEERISRWWRYSVVIVVLIGFAILSMVTKLTYDNAPPIPQRVVDASGNLLFTGEQILEGQSAFLHYNLMEHGTLWGHGAYLGPDYSAKHLHETALTIRDGLAQEIYHRPFDQLSEDERSFLHENIPRMMKENRYDATAGTLVYTKEQTEAFRKSIESWRVYFNEGKAPGLHENYISNPRDLFNLVSFFSWASWAASTLRPDAPYTYTNNFPYDPLVGNNPSTDAFFWSAMSLITLLGGIGLLLFLFGKNASIDQSLRNPVNYCLLFRTGGME
jgi:nitric oxide reductase subunit B